MTNNLINNPVHCEILAFGLSDKSKHDVDKNSTQTQLVWLELFSWVIILQSTDEQLRGHNRKSSIQPPWVYRQF